MSRRLKVAEIATSETARGRSLCGSQSRSRRIWAEIELARGSWKMHVSRHGPSTPSPYSRCVTAHRAAWEQPDGHLSIVRRLRSPRGDCAGGFGGDRNGCQRVRLHAQSLSYRGYTAADDGRRESDACDRLQVRQV